MHTTTAGRYRDLAEAWARVGYIAIPLRRPGEPCWKMKAGKWVRVPATGKEPAVSFGVVYGLDREGVLRQIREWVAEHGDRPGGALLLDPIPGSGMPEIDVIDVDDLDELPWTTDTFGSSPVEQTSGRVGGGRHLLYRIHTGNGRGQPSVGV